jgi:hypothetical protein
METLDLHGVRHEEVERLVGNFAYKTEVPFKIITGNSARMKDLVRQVLARLELDAYEESDQNRGALVVVDEPKKFTHIREVF